MLVRNLRSLRYTGFNQHADFVGYQIIYHLLTNLAVDFVWKCGYQRSTIRGGTLIKIRQKHTHIDRRRLIVGIWIGGYIGTGIGGGGKPLQKRRARSEEACEERILETDGDRKSTRLNSTHRTE